MRQVNKTFQNKANTTHFVLLKIIIVFIKVLKPEGVSACSPIEGLRKMEQQPVAVRQLVGTGWHDGSRAQRRCSFVISFKEQAVAGLGLRRALIASRQSLQIL